MDHGDWGSACRVIVSGRNTKGSGNRNDRDEGGESVVCVLGSENVREFDLENERGNDRVEFLICPVEDWPSETVSGP